MPCLIRALTISAIKDKEKKKQTTKQAKTQNIFYGKKLDS